MILIDPRRGSGELEKYFRVYNIPYTEQFMEASDFAFYGEGPEGMELVGFERKVLSDFMQSKRDNRLQGFQLPKMGEIFPTFSHLILEGIWRADPETGMIQTRYGKAWSTTRPAMMYRELDHFIAELTYKRGVFFERTAGPDQTAAYVVSRYKFFNDQVWSQHDRTEKIYAPCNPAMGPGGRSVRSGFRQRHVPTLEKMLMQVSGVESTAYWVAKEWGNVEKILEATEMQLAGTFVEQNTKTGRKPVKLGPAKAKKIFEAMREQ
jgi:ERCC4-type nuclease